MIGHLLGRKLSDRCSRDYHGAHEDVTCAQEREIGALSNAAPAVWQEAQCAQVS